MHINQPLHPLDQCEEEIANSSEVLLRIVKVHSLDKATLCPTLAAFHLTDDDEEMLSLFQKSKIKPEKLFEHAVEQDAKTRGIWGVSISTVHQSGLRAVADENCDLNEDQAPGHSYIDFRGLSHLSKNDKKKIRVDLLESSTRLYFKAL